MKMLLALLLAAGVAEASAQAGGITREKPCRPT